MSISTSANLIGFFSIPVILGDEPTDDKITFTFWLNAFVSAGVVVFYILGCIPLMCLEQKTKAQNAQIREVEHAAQVTRYSMASSVRNSMSAGVENTVRSDPEFIMRFQAMQDFTQKVPNNMQWYFRLQKYFNLNIDFWIINLSYAWLLSCCYGSQTMLITYLGYTPAADRAEICGIVRSVASVVGGPLSGWLVGKIGRRPLLLLISYVLSMASFAALLWYDMPPYIPMFLIGFFDGCSASLGKSMFTYVVPPNLLNNAYALSGSLLNLG